MTDVVVQYFRITDLLLKGIEQQGMPLDSGSQGSIELNDIICQLSHPFEQADQIRLAYIEISSKIESELRKLHAKGLYPDLYCGATSKFKLMEDIASIHKDVLLNQGSSVPKFTLKGTPHAWRDNGLLGFATDQQAYLRSTRFNNLWDAVQCYEMHRYLIAQLFEYLDLTDNL